MKTLVQQLSQYALYHRDPRNIMTHYVGIPLIVIAIFSLLGAPLLAGFSLTHGLIVGSCLFYLLLDLRFGLVMLAFSACCYAAAVPLLALPFSSWLTASIGIFVVGWVFQFIGHYFEGKKPAFVDDLVGLLIGPMFILAELAFSLGIAKGLQAQIDEVAGPVRKREVAKL